MNGWMDVWTDGWTDRQTDGWTDGGTDDNNDDDVHHMFTYVASFSALCFAAGSMFCQQMQTNNSRLVIDACMCAWMCVARCSMAVSLSSYSWVDLTRMQTQTPQSKLALLVFCQRLFTWLLKVPLVRTASLAALAIHVTVVRLCESASTLHVSVVRPCQLASALHVTVVRSCHLASALHISVVRPCQSASALHVTVVRSCESASTLHVTVVRSCQSVLCCQCYVDILFFIYSRKLILIFATQCCA